MPSNKQERVLPLSVLERNPKKTMFTISLLGILLVLAGAELGLRLFLGLGDPLLYRSSPLFGYRLQPDQFVHRRGCEIRVNNLGLRADRDWDSNISDKILFLGNSATFGGTYISNDKLFSYLAVQGLEGYIDGNAGVNGWGIENIATFIVDNGFLPSRIYVSVLQDMDFYRGLSKLSGKPFWTTKPTFALQELLALFYVDRLQGMYENHDRLVTQLENDKAVERSCMKLKAMDDYLKSHSYRHLIYLSTNISELIEGATADTVVAKYLNQYGIKATYLKDDPEIVTLTMQQRKDLFYDWNHFNVAGHALVGKIIHKDLVALLNRRSDEP